MSPRFPRIYHDPEVLAALGDAMFEVHIRGVRKAASLGPAALAYPRLPQQPPSARVWACSRTNRSDAVAPPSALSAPFSPCKLAKVNKSRT
jgi:hypothetical protein